MSRNIFHIDTGVYADACNVPAVFFFLALAAHLLFFPGMAVAGAAHRKPATLPVVTSRMAEEGKAGGQAEKPVRKKAADKAGGGKNTDQAGRVQGFSSNPFALEHRSPSAKAQREQKNAVSGETGVARTKAAEAKGEQEQKVTVSGSAKQLSDDRLLPQRAAFSGGPHTIGHMDTPKQAPELKVKYATGGNATTQLVLNPQDTSSPLYRPAEREGLINSAGVYMNVKVKPNMQLRVGGEYCDIPGTHASGESNAQGASIGLKWDF